jgi:hypothetical protein
MVRWLRSHGSLAGDQIETDYNGVGIANQGSCAQLANDLGQVLRLPALPDTGLESRWHPAVAGFRQAAATACTEGQPGTALQTANSRYFEIYDQIISAAPGA